MTKTHKMPDGSIMKGATHKKSLRRLYANNPPRNAPSMAPKRPVKRLTPGLVSY